MINLFFFLFKYLGEFISYITEAPIHYTIILVPHCHTSQYSFGNVIHIIFIIIHFW